MLLPCCLCLREYKDDYMQYIFANNSNLNEQILLAVSIEFFRDDSTDYICFNCKDLIALINNFRSACQQANDLLKNQPRTIRTSTWERSTVEETFSQAANLVQQHRNEIEDFKLKLNETEVGKLTEDLIKCEAYLEEPVLPELLLQIKVEEDDSAEDDLSEETPAPELNRDNPKKKANKKVLCITCGELVSQETLEGHRNRHAGVQPFTCDVPGCDAKLYSKRALQRHHTWHRTTNMYFDCEVCGKRIKGKAYWLRHQKIHTEEPRFGCDICGKKFRLKCKLQDHSTVHTGIAKFKCEICDKFFTIKHNLKAHYKIHAKNEQKATKGVASAKG